MNLIPCIGFKPASLLMGICLVCLCGRLGAQDEPPSSRAVTSVVTAADPQAAIPTRLVALDPRSAGRTFEGIGALSAGASSRLLIDYPEPQRSQILDLLFLPKFGAGFQHLKVEVGGDVNSTDGTEPSHRRTRHDRNFERGYEWWLAAEARRRNPAILLDCLQWGAPAWVGNGHFYSQDNADFLVDFLLGAQRVHGLRFDYAGVWNETRYDTGWIKLFRRTLDRRGLGQVRIVAPDEINAWSIVDLMPADPELARAVAVVGAHYPKFKSSAAAQAAGKPIWASEDGPWKGTWEGAGELARMYNRNYVEGRMTKTIIWSPVTSYYDNLPLPGSGTMKANTPWSGHYEVQPALWATAQTTQFAAPGWRYLDAACGQLAAGGSFVTLLAPNGRDWSVIVETLGAKADQDLGLRVDPALAAGPVQVWHSDAHAQFIRLPDLTAGTGASTARLKRDSLYSFTTTSGQRKGGLVPPGATPFPLPYTEDFEGYRPGSAPLYFADQAGVFEVAAKRRGQGKALSQVIDRKGIEWHFHWNPFPETFLGDLAWTNYAVDADARIEAHGFVALFGRVGTVPQNENLPNAYRLKVSDAGYWELGNAKAPLASGRSAVRAGRWHNLKLRFAGDVITAFIDHAPVGTVTNGEHTAGMVGVGSGWHGAQFDNLSVTPAP